MQDEDRSETIKEFYLGKSCPLPGLLYPNYKVGGLDESPRVWGGQWWGARGPLPQQACCR